MKINKKYISVFLVAILLFLVYLGYSFYNKPVADLTNAAVEVTTNADNLVLAYETNEVLANKKYLGKVALIDGAVVELINKNDSILNIVIGNELSLSKVSCSLNKNQLAAFKKCKIGQPIKLKGICTGYLADVEINRAVIVTESSKN